MQLLVVLRAAVLGLHGLLGGAQFLAVDTGGFEHDEELTRLFRLAFLVERLVHLGQGLRRVLVLGETKARRADQARGQHADAAHDTDGHRTGAWEAVRRNRQHGGPEEGLADRVNGQGKDRRDEGGHVAGNVQADAGKDRADQQDTYRGKLQLALDEMRAEAKTEHDGRGPHEEELALLRGQDIARDVLDPAIGTELNRTHEGMRDKQAEQQQ